MDDRETSSKEFNALADGIESMAKINGQNDAPKMQSSSTPNLTFKYNQYGYDYYVDVHDRWYAKDGFNHWYIMNNAEGRFIDCQMLPRGPYGNPAYYPVPSNQQQQTRQQIGANEQNNAWTPYYREYYQKFYDYHYGGPNSTMPYYQATIISATNRSSNESRENLESQMYGPKIEVASQPAVIVVDSSKPTEEAHIDKEQSKSDEHRKSHSSKDGNKNKKKKELDRLRDEALATLERARKRYEYFVGLINARSLDNSLVDRKDSKKVEKKRKNKSDEDERQKRKKRRAMKRKQEKRSKAREMVHRHHRGCKQESTDEEEEERKRSKKKQRRSSRKFKKRSNQRKSIDEEEDESKWRKRKAKRSESGSSDEEEEVRASSKKKRKRQSSG